MLLIETFLHLSPDNGSGTTELAIVIVIFAGFLLAKLAGTLRRAS